MFTNEREINAMLDLVKQKKELVDSCSLEPDIFKKVTGLTKDDFDLLLSLNIFNGARMNDAVYKFKRYEDDSLSYAGIDKHENDTHVGLFDTAVPMQEFEEM